MTMTATAAPLRLTSSLVCTVRKTLDAIPLSVPQLIARLAVANVFWRSGQTKLANWDSTIQLFQNEYHVPLLPPDVAATLAASCELGCSVLLVLGLFTRLATLPLLGMILVIQVFVYPANWPDHLLWTALLLFVLARGPGVISVDHLMGRVVAGRP